MGRERSCCRWNLLFGCEAAGRREQWNQEQEASDPHGQPNRQVVPRCPRGEAPEGTAVVAGTAHVGVQDLTQTMRSAVVDVGHSGPLRIPVALGREADYRAKRTEQENAE